jgi:hypothetical protein
MGNKAVWAGLAAAALLISSTGAQAAQAPGADGRTVYEAAYFAQFAPSNALQMVQRVPGFTLELGNQEVRGFGQAAGNVVVNGQRPAPRAIRWRRSWLGSRRSGSPESRSARATCSGRSSPASRRS